jgi:hypothetical protein
MVARTRWIEQTRWIVQTRWIEQVRTDRSIGRGRIIARCLRSLVAALVFASVAVGADALTIELPTDCESCQGLTGSLEILDLGGSFSVTLTLNSDSYTGARDGINQVGFGGITGWSDVSLLSSPVSSTTAWSAPVEAVTSSNSLCTVGTSSDKVCTSGFVAITGGGDFVWEFAVEGGTLDAGAWHIGAQFSDLAGPARGQILSEGGSSAPIPEPVAALIFGVCLLAVSRSGRRR